MGSLGRGGPHCIPDKDLNMSPKYPVTEQGGGGGGGARRHTKPPRVESHVNCFAFAKVVSSVASGEIFLVLELHGFKL